MGGGIIIQRSSVLLKAINDPCFYNDLNDTDRDAVEQINAKAPHDRTEDDVRYLAAKISELSHQP